MKAWGKDLQAMRVFKQRVSVRALLWAAIMLGGLLAGAGAGARPAAGGAEALPTSGTFTASDFEWAAAGGGHTVTIVQGGTVSFGYPSGRSEHNAHFTTGQPSSCAQTAGDRSGAVPPLPRVPTGAGWTGTCTFNQPGTYTFHCDRHPFMTGSVAVQASGTSATDSPLSGAPGQAIRFAPSQRGNTVRGTLRISRAGAGGTVQATGVFANRVAARLSARLRPGAVKLLLKLNRAATAVLTRKGQLSLQVKLVVRAPAGRTVRITRKVLLRH
jgi:plastocyanin